jgi:hypothetical protein
MHASLYNEYGMMLCINTILIDLDVMIIIIIEFAHVLQVTSVCCLIVYLIG